MSCHRLNLAHKKKTYKIKYKNNLSYSDNSSNLPQPKCQINFVINSQISYANEKKNQILLLPQSSGDDNFL